MSESERPSLLAMRGDRFTLMLVTGLTLTAFGVGAAVQTAAVYQLTVSGNFGAQVEPATMLPRVFTNCVTIILVLLLMYSFRLEQRQGVVLVAVSALACVIPALTRSALQLSFDVYSTKNGEAILVDIVGAIFVTALTIAFGLVFVRSARRLRIQEMANARQEVRASAALAALQSEELRVRREVAEVLHGTVQQRLVLVETQLRGMAEGLEAKLPTASGPLRDTADALRALAGEVDELREVDVRNMSQLLYPVGVDIGILQATRMLMRRVPDSISVRITADEALREEMNSSRSESQFLESRISLRIVILRVLEEALTNALRHGHASAVEIRFAGNHDGDIVVTFDDNGAGLGHQQPQMNGLGLLRERISALGGTLTIANGPLGGVRVQTAIPRRILDGSEPAMVALSQQ